MILGVYQPGPDSRCARNNLNFGGLTLEGHQQVTGMDGPESCNYFGNGILGLDLCNFSHPQKIVLGPDGLFRITFVRWLHGAVNSETLSRRKSRGTASLGRLDIDNIVWADKFLVTQALEYLTHGIDRRFANESNPTHAAVMELNRWRLGLRFHRGNFNLGSDLLHLGLVLNVAFAVQANAFSRINPVGIGQLFVFLPQIRPLPGGVIEALRNVPEGVALFHRIIESGLQFRFFLDFLTQSRCQPNQHQRQSDEKAH